MKIYLVIPDEEAEKMNGFLKKKCHTMELKRDSLATAGHGAIFDGDKLFTREHFRQVRNHFGAVLIGENRHYICDALDVPIDEPGIIEGVTEAECAKHLKVSRQYIHQQIKKGKINAVKIGSLLIIKGE